ncbi:MAG: response regulator [Clostridia bacterium]|nr:response regulator [Clostridia bacterium]
MHICICDDDKSQHEIIKNYINGFSLLTQRSEIVSHFSGNDLIKDCMSGVSFDMLFMDIQLDCVSGIEVAQTVRRLNSNTIYHRNEKMTGQGQQAARKALK